TGTRPLAIPASSCWRWSTEPLPKPPRRASSVASARVNLASSLDHLQYLDPAVYGRSRNVSDSARLRCDGGLHSFDARGDDWRVDVTRRLLIDPIDPQFSQGAVQNFPSKVAA